MGEQMFGGDLSVNGVEMLVHLGSPDWVGCNREFDDARTFFQVGAVHRNRPGDWGQSPLPSPGSQFNRALKHEIRGTRQRNVAELIAHFIKPNL